MLKIYANESNGSEIIEKEMDTALVNHQDKGM